MSTLPIPYVNSGNLSVYELLTPNDLVLIKLLSDINYSIEQDASECEENKNFFGFHDPKRKLIILCLSNIVDVVEGPLFKEFELEDLYLTSFHLSRTLRHEVIHVAQKCNGYNILPKDERDSIKIQPSKIKALFNSFKFSNGNIDSEIEAYYLEDFPKRVKILFSKFCLGEN